MKIIRLRRESDLIRKESGRVFNFNIYYNHYELAKCPRCEERYLVLINYKWAGRGVMRRICNKCRKSDEYRFYSPADVPDDVLRTAIKNSRGAYDIQNRKQIEEYTETVEIGEVV